MFLFWISLPVRERCYVSNFISLPVGESCFYFDLFSRWRKAGLAGPFRRLTLFETKRLSRRKASSFQTLLLGRIKATSFSP